MPCEYMEPRFDMLAGPRWVLSCGDGMSGRMQSTKVELRDVRISLWTSGLVRVALVSYAPATASVAGLHLTFELRLLL